MMLSTTVLLRLVVSAVLSGLIGLEREIHGCAAGLRTHILVCMGSTLFMITSIGMAVQYGDLGGADPSRIAAGVVTGIGFLGAGAIIRYGGNIRGLTTAASIWAVSAIGLAVGAGLYAAAGMTTFIALAVLILSRLEERMELKAHGKKLKVTISRDGGIDKDDIENIIGAYSGTVKKAVLSEAPDAKEQDIVFALVVARIHHKDLIAEIESLPGVIRVGWE
ncbi:MAG: MgtC/SapB family protein [Candidatus Omnitrophota bacterium]